MGIKVLYVISTLGGGGAENQLFYFCSNLSKKESVSFDVCAIRDGGVLEKRFINIGVKPLILNARSFLKAVIKLRKTIKRGGYDIVHAHMFFSDIVCRLATLGLKVKIVCTHHGLGMWKKNWLVLFDKMTKNRVDHFIVVSERSYEIRKTREKYPPAKMSVIYNGVPDYFFMDSKKQLPKDVIVFGCVARFTKNKQMNYLVEVLNKLKKTYNLRLELVGEGEEFSSVQKLVSDYNLENNVVFHGWSDKIRDIISSWDYFMLCSINEDLPVSLLEAMAVGLVPIATNVGGIPKLLNYGELGVLCDSNDFQSYCDGLTSLIESHKYSIISEKCIEYVRKNFSIENNVEKCLALYSSILQRGE